MLILTAILTLLTPPGMAASPALEQRPAAARVYVYTAQAPGGPVSEEEQGRLEALRDVQDALGRRKKDFTLVPTAEEAELIVEVVNREEREAPQGGFGGKSVSKFRDTIVRLHVKAGDDLSDMKGIGRGSWSSAAKDAVERLAKWVKNRRERKTAGV